MDELPKLEVVPKSGSESFTANGEDLDVRLLDFWKWSVSDLVSNATRGRLAEFIVATALDLDTTNDVRSEWDAFDLQIPGVATIEVKSCAYIQSWMQSAHSKISFSVRTSRHWDSSTSVWSGEVKRQADIYVFCLLNFRGEKSKVNPLDMDQWEFYAVPTMMLDAHFPGSQSISLASLQKLTPAVKYEGLKKRVLDCASLK